MVPRLAEQKLAMRQDNALMDLRRQGMEMDQQRFNLEQDKFASQVEQQQAKLAELAQFRQAAGQLENTPEGHAQLQRRFPMLYKEAGLSSMLPEQPKLSSDYQTYLSGMGMQNSPEAYRAWQDSVIAQERAGATQISNVVNNSKGQDKVDTTYAPEYVEAIAGGGIADMLSQVETLENVATRLRTEKGLTGARYAMIPEAALPVVAPDAVAVRDDVFNTVQRSLKEVLGAQFTEKEGEMLLRRGYDMRLPPEENARRVERLAKQIRVAAEAKASAAKYFETHGTMTGWRGKVYTLEDFKRDRVPLSTPKPSLRQEAPPGAIKKLRENPGLAHYFKEKYGYLPEGF